MKINIEETTGEPVIRQQNSYALRSTHLENDFQAFLSMFADYGGGNGIKAIDTTTVKQENVHTAQKSKSGTHVEEPSSHAQEEDDLSIKNTSSSHESDMQEHKMSVSDIHFNDLSQADLQFFYDIVQKGELSIKHFDAGHVQFLSEHAGNVYRRSLQLTDKVKDLVSKLYKDSMPVRINFNQDLSVVLKLDKNGKLSAEFMPHNHAMEQAMASHIQTLRERLESKNIEYKAITYKNREENHHKKNRERK